MKILVAYDGSNCADAAVEDMLRAGLPSEAECFVVCVTEHPSPENMAEADALARNAAARIQSYFPEWTLSTEALSGPPAATILDASRSWKTDLLIVGSHGRSRIKRLLLGSVSMELIHKARCSVRVGRPERSRVAGPLRIVVGNDGSTAAQAVVQEIARRSWPEGTEVRVVSVVESLVPAGDPLAEGAFSTETAFQVIEEADIHEWNRLRTVAEESVSLLRHAGLKASMTITEADPRQELIAEAYRIDADAIFVGACGHGRLERLLLGSVSAAAVTRAHCAVEVVRHDVNVIPRVS